jgi:hypothetical protein
MNRQLMLEVPVAPALARLAFPVLVVLAVQTLVGVAETYSVSSLGTAAMPGFGIAGAAVAMIALHRGGGCRRRLSSELELRDPTRAFGAINAIAMATGRAWNTPALRVARD